MKAKPFLLTLIIGVFTLALASASFAQRPSRPGTLPPPPPPDNDGGIVSPR